MFGKIKKALGIEGVKLEIILPPQLNKASGKIDGQIRFYSQSAQTVTAVKVKLIERYSRGKKENQLIDEYLLGDIYLEQKIKVPANETIEIDFSLPFQLMQSEMDEYENSNIVFGGLVKAAKWFSSVQSNYRIEATAKVKGVALDPFNKKVVELK